MGLQTRWSIFRQKIKSITKWDLFYRFIEIIIIWSLILLIQIDWAIFFGESTPYDILKDVAITAGSIYVFFALTSKVEQFNMEKSKNEKRKEILQLLAQYRSHIDTILLGLQLGTLIELERIHTIDYERNLLEGYFESNFVNPSMVEQCALLLDEYVKTYHKSSDEIKTHSTSRDIKLTTLMREIRKTVIDAEIKP